MSDLQERGLTAQRDSDSVSTPPAEISAPDRSSAIAKWVFAGALVGTGIFLLVGFTRLWFSLDEWDFLAHRGLRLTNMGIFYPHNEHWVTIPLLVWRGIFNIVGVRDYWLYALPLILAHLTTVYLLWRFMLRHQVEMWTATFLAVAFAVVGVGSQNLIFAFQLTFVGSVAFGMLAIDAIETDRTWLAPLWLVGSLMCSDIGIPMIVACGLVALAQRKLREAAIAVGPPIFIFLVWYLAIGYHGSASNSTSVKFDLGGLSSYVWTGLTSSFSGFLDAPHFVGVLIAVLLGAAAIVYRNAPAALAASVLPLYVFIGLGRLHEGVGQSTASRYSYIAIAMVLPLIGLLVTQAVRISYLRPLVLIALGLLIAVNLVVLHRQQVAQQSFLRLTNGRTQMDAAAYLLHQGNTYPAQFPGISPCATIGNLPCVTEDIPHVSTLAGWVQRNQFPVPSRIAPAVLRAEQSVLNVSVSSAPKYQKGGSAVAPTQCTTIDPYKRLTVRSSSPVSLLVDVDPSQNFAILTVAFPALDGNGPTSTLVVLPRRSSWLNLPLGRYSTAVVASIDSVQVCQGQSP
ncbi:MAG: hypothetical protein WB565_17365 [Acidimicrobiales bacterium]